MKFDHANFNFTITNYCNYSCSYCIQGNYQNETEMISPKIFKLIIKKIFKEAKGKLKSLDFTLMGGELSTLDTKEYFQIIKDETPDELQVCINFLTNFSGEIDYFLFLDSITQPNITVVIDSTLHENYSTNVSKRIKDKILLLKDTSLELKFSFLEGMIPNKVIHIYKDFFEEHGIEFKIEKLRGVGYITADSSRTVRCNALYYNILPDAKIRDTCRGIQFNFLTFKFQQKEIVCSKECPCPFLKTEFTQVEI